MPKKMPVLYIPHGGGPLPLLGDENHRELIEFLKGADKALHKTCDGFQKPSAILMITAHWESNVASISSSMQPTMIHDYGGFPQETYEYQYPAPGDPELANQVEQILRSHNIECQLDSARGFDHGTFVPLMLMYPEAEIPVVQVSLLRSLDPQKHIEIGEALSALRGQGVLIIGSGMSFHHRHGSLNDSNEFDAWLRSVITESKPSQTRQKLIEWEQAPAARQCHAREEHLLPLHVCFGAASAQNETAETMFGGMLFNRKVSAFVWR